MSWWAWLLVVLGPFLVVYAAFATLQSVLVLPVLVVFLTLQRYFQPGIATTGLKG